MDPKTADELFGSSDDAGVDFFSQSSQSQNSEAEVSGPAEEEQQAYAYNNTIAQDNHQAAQYDPYSQLQASSAVRTPSTARPAAAPAASQRDPYAPQVRDPYAPQANGSSYQPTSTASTYTPPASHGAQYDPYAAIPRKPSYNPYSPAPSHNYAPAAAYTPQPSAYSPVVPPPAISAVPTPPAPTSTDVSKYRSTPNAYDPPIRSKPVARTPSRQPSVPNPYTTAPVHHHTSPAPPPPGAPGFYPPVRQTPPPPPTMSPTHHSPYAAPPTMSPTHHSPYGAKPSAPQIKPSQPPTHAGPAPPPPRAVSPYTHRSPVVAGTPPPPRSGVSDAYRHPGSTGTPPPPRPSSSASNQSDPYGRPPSALGATSRPTSAASNPRGGMKSPPRTQSIASAMSEMQPPRRSSDHLRVPYEDPMDMEGGATPTVASVGRNQYMDAGNAIEDAYPPLEQDEILENMALANQTSPVEREITPPPAPAPADPYATLQRSSSSTYTVSPPMSTTSSRQNSLVEPPPPMNKPPQATAPKAVPPPPRANPYAPPSGGVSMPPQPPPPHASGMTPSSSFRDAYAPPASQPIATGSLAPNPVIDLSHSPPNTRHIPTYDPYNPARGAGTMSRKNTARPPYGVPPPGPAYGYTPAVAAAPEPPAPTFVAPGGAQYAAVSQAPPTQGNYAPSPSLLGTNDPLGRASVRAPIFSFGFGGRVVACFHTTPGATNFAFDGAGGIGMIPPRPSTALVVKTLKDCIAPSAYDVTCAGFPGPLFGDVGPGGASSVLTTAGAATKAKKAAIATWLDAAIKEAEEGVVYAGAALPQAGTASKAEGRLVLMKLLKIWVENDGKVSGSPAIDDAVKTALLGPAEAPTTLGGAAVPSFGVPAFYGGEPAHASRDSSITYQVKGSSLDRLQDLLTRGERRAAYQFALDEKLWSHALLISSSMDKEAWKEVAHEFIKAELNLSADQSASGRESLRLAYGLFAGDGPEAMKLLVPPTSFGISGVQMHSRASSGGLSNLDSPVANATAVPEQTWMQWKKLLAATISNQPVGDTTPTTALGDFLLSNNWVDVAHCCYLLAPATSLLAGASTPGVRTVLFGSANPSKFSTFHTSLQPIILSEIAEYAKSLVPPVKGQEPFQGLQHLQAYRLWYAACLAEMGEVVLAKRYTDAINATVRMSTRGSPYYTATFIEQLEELHDRLVEAPHADKTKAWISKPSVRSLNEWITGGLEKLIQGDEAPPKDAQAQGKKSLEIPAAIGPFSHYSAISSATPSAQPSPSPSYANLHSASSSIARTESATGYRPAPAHSSTLPTPAPPRAASAMDYPRGRASPAPKPVKASLGEESAFYYDAELKKWVNKKAGPDAAAPKAPPPPPSRAQTASPSRAGLPPNMATPPPPRAASVMPSSSLAPPPRPSSTLSATSDTGSYTDSSMPPSRGSPAPPMSGLPPRPGQTPPPSTGSPAGSVSGRAAAKKNARSRYVDVFQAP
ncbi:hypothetical protein M408DRAFT_16038 [Serendipita vermifera MAFF 305830]|uniref:Protein transport protein sec16 n=1 Tax=Serendipita vermifera MAFF 305830 TaxID=933852 RepID=A0A0C3BC50_SERVB|nr:hypothetical protein M408DRAFT_16038 [Serendipita vermifera MAFF 305830]